MKLGNKGQGGVIIALIIFAASIFVAALVAQELDTSLSISAVASPYNTSWDSISDNSISGFNLVTLAPILLAASGLIGLIYVLARR